MVLHLLEFRNSDSLSVWKTGNQVKELGRDFTHAYPVLKVPKLNQKFGCLSIQEYSPSCRIIHDLALVMLRG